MLGNLQSLDEFQGFFTALRLQSQSYDVLQPNCPRPQPLNCSGELLRSMRWEVNGQDVSPICFNCQVDFSHCWRWSGMTSNRLLQHFQRFQRGMLPWNWRGRGNSCSIQDEVGIPRVTTWWPKEHMRWDFLFWEPQACSESYTTISCFPFGVFGPKLQQKHHFSGVAAVLALEKRATTGASNGHRVLKISDPGCEGMPVDSDGYPYQSASRASTKRKGWTQKSESRPTPTLVTGFKGQVGWPEKLLCQALLSSGECHCQWLAIAFRCFNRSNSKSSGCPKSGLWRCQPLSPNCWRFH